MNIFMILTKEVKQHLRNPKAMAMMVLFPIVLMTVLGTALSGLFDTSANFKNIEVIYTKSDEHSAAMAFQVFAEQAEEMGVQFTEAKNVEEGVEGVKNGKYACFVKVDEEGVELFKNDRYAFKADLIETLLGSFIQRYNTIAVIGKFNPAAAGEIIEGNTEVVSGEKDSVNAVSSKASRNEATGSEIGNISINDGEMNFVKQRSLGDRKQPKAVDYYAVTMLTLIIMYASQSGAYAILSEKTAKTANRLLCSPVRKHEIFLGKIIGTIMITLLQALVLIVFSKYVLGAYWGSHMATVLLLILAQIIMAVSLGIGLAFVIKGESTLIGLLNVVTPVVVFLGGGYMPIEGFSKTLLQVAEMSPLRWINQAIFQVIYSNDFSLVTTAIAINLGLAAIFAVVSIFAIRKEAF